MLVDEQELLSRTAVCHRNGFIAAAGWDAIKVFVTSTETDAQPGEPRTKARHLFLQPRCLLGNQPMCWKEFGPVAPAELIKRDFLNSPACEFHTKRFEIGNRLTHQHDVCAQAGAVIVPALRLGEINDGVAERRIASAPSAEFVVNGADAVHTDGQLGVVS